MDLTNHNNVNNYDEKFDKENIHTHVSQFILTSANLNNLSLAYETSRVRT